MYVLVVAGRRADSMCSLALPAVEEQNVMQASEMLAALLRVVV